MIDLTKLKSAARAATPGPWYAKASHPADGVECYWLQSESGAITGLDGPQVGQSAANAAYIAACDPQTILALVRIARAAIAADDALHSPHTAEQAALREVLRKEGGR